MLNETDRVTTKYLTEYFNVSFDTVRRDILRLTSTGQAVRFHGGIMSNNLNDVPNYRTRSHIKSPIKSNMAAIAEKMVIPKRLYFIGTSTTLTLLCELLNKKNITVITNSIDNALSLSQNIFPRVELLGGQLDKGNRYTYSLETLTQLDYFTFDTIFVGTSRICAEGIYVVDEDDAFILKKAIARSKRIIVIAEQYKFNSKQSSPYKLADCSEVDILITDSKLRESYKQWFKESIKIQYVK